MKDYIAERVLDIAKHLLDNKCTVREVADVFCVSKSTAHKDLHKRLKELDIELYRQVSELMQFNWDERYLRGGEATKRKYNKNPD